MESCTRELSELSTFYPKTVTESIVKNVVFFKQKQDDK
jgi:hypothetical protein